MEKVIEYDFLDCADFIKDIIPDVVYADSNCCGFFIKLKDGSKRLNWILDGEVRSKITKEAFLKRVKTGWIELNK
jgi:hypothetical protein